MLVECSKREMGGWDRRGKACIVSRLLAVLPVKLSPLISE